VKIVSYKKAGTREPEDKPCWLISASPLDDVTSGMHALIKRIILKSRVATVQSLCGLHPSAVRDLTT
jgi:hypothetical protein